MIENYLGRIFQFFVQIFYKSKKIYAEMQNGNAFTERITQNAFTERIQKNTLT